MSIFKQENILTGCQVLTADIRWACRFHLQQLLNGKYDSQLPSLGSGSPEEQRMEAEMERYMENFKMQASTLACSALFEQDAFVP